MFKSLMITLAGMLVCFACAGANPINSNIAKVKKQYAPDGRQAIFEVTTSTDPSDPTTTIVSGRISDAQAYDALCDMLMQSNAAVDNQVKLMPQDDWALTRLSVACMRTAPKHGAEMATQSLMGMPLRIFEERDGWYRVQTPDGYIGWMTTSSLIRKTPAEMEAWRGDNNRMVVVTPYQTRAYTSSTAQGLRDVVSDLVLSNIVTSTGVIENGRIAVVLPDGRTGWVPQADLLPIGDWAAQEYDPQRILDIAYSMEGTPYLWGGTSVKSLDCSGLVKTSYLANALILMRDASQQALLGQRIEAKDWRNNRAGDLLFFGNAKTGKVTHVAIYDHDGNYVHSSGRVKRNSVDPEAPSYLTTPFLHSVRIDGHQGQNGITRAAEHPWYFNR